MMTMSTWLPWLFAVCSGRFSTQLCRDCFISHYKDPGTWTNQDDSWFMSSWESRAPPPPRQATPPGNWAPLGSPWPHEMMSFTVMTLDWRKPTNRHLAFRSMSLDSLVTQWYWHYRARHLEPFLGVWWWCWWLLFSKKGGRLGGMLIERVGKKHMWLVRFSFDLFHSIFNYKYVETHCLLVTLQKYSRCFI